MSGATWSDLEGSIEVSSLLELVRSPGASQGWCGRGDLLTAR
jgi:hypothetical protein